MEPGIIVHSGAGWFPDERNEEKLEISRRAALEGAKVLLETDDPVLAVEAAVSLMEDNVSCNAGYGSVLTATGEVEMDAIIIRGSDLAMGGVGGIKSVKNPICVSRRVLESSPHVLLVGEGALGFARTQGFEIVEGESLVSLRAKAMLDNVLSKRMEASTETGGSATSSSSSKKQESGLGTVGAVAINSKGQLAAATSTGGICGKLPGRVGDTPIPGGGTYCDDRSCGLSATGLGESIMRVCLTSKIASLIDTGKNPTESCMTMLNEMTDRVGGDGGVVGITKGGDMIHAHNSKKMTWAWVRKDEVHSGCQPGEEFIDKIDD